MTAALALLDQGRVLGICCDGHVRGPIGSCCDTDDCGPCCPECPTCPRCAAFEAAKPGWRKTAAQESQRWQREFNSEFRALGDIGRALWWFDRHDYSRFVIHPDVPKIVYTSRAVARTTWDLVF